MTGESPTERPALPRVIGLWGAVWLGLGAIIGSGVFVSLSLATSVGGPAVLVAVVLAALVAMANGLSSAQLAAAHPVSGGTYAYGHRYLSPTAGFAAGWMFLAAKSASAATAALGCASYLLHAVGGATGTPARMSVALALVGLLTLWASGGSQRSSRLNMLTVAVTLVGLGALVVCGWAAAPKRHMVWHLATDAWRHAQAAPLPLLQATALMFVAYTGYGRIATLGEEVIAPARTIPRAILATLALAMLVYTAVAATALAILGAPAFATASHAGGAPLEAVAHPVQLPWLARGIAAAAVTAMTGVLLNLLLGLSRVLLAMARLGEMPTSLAHIDPGSQSPRRAVWVIGAVIALLVLVGDVQLTWSFSAFSVLVYYGITHLAALRQPATERRLPRGIAVIGLVSCFGLAALVPWRVWLSGTALLAVGFAWRGWLARPPRRPHSPHSPHGPGSPQG